MTWRRLRGRRYPARSGASRRTIKTCRSRSNQKSPPLYDAMDRVISRDMTLLRHTQNDFPA